MDFENIKNKLEQYKREGKRMFASSSFQTHSIVLLHIISRIDKDISIYFINTGFLFPETIAYKDQLAKEFGLNIINTKSDVPKSLQKDAHGNLLFTSDPDHCCHINKVQPLDSVLADNDVWINGVRADQSAVRKAMEIEQAAPHDVIRFHPMLDWSKKDIYQYLKDWDLPRHPLEAQGYDSIGCEPCTRKMAMGDDRGSRWFGMKKTECGLNTDLVVKKK